MDQTPLLSLHLLADRNLKPGAIEFCVGSAESGDANTLIPLLANPQFAKVVTRLPCLISAQQAQACSPELTKVLKEAGIRTVAETSIHRVDEGTRPVLPAPAEWLAGNWSLAQPVRAAGNQTVSRGLSLKLLQKVAEDADTCEIEAIFRQEPVLAYHLLRLVNSIGVGVGRTISSFSQAILILGRQQLKRWLNLMLFAANRDDHRSAMLLAHVAVRARSMELLAKADGLDRSTQEYAFMTGMFSLLGSLFGLSLPDVLKPLKLPATLVNALLRHEGELGLLLAIVEKAEQADTEGLRENLNRLGLSMSDYIRLSLEAHQWMLGVINEQESANA